MRLAMAAIRQLATSNRAVLRAEYRSILASLASAVGAERKSQAERAALFGASSAEGRAIREKLRARLLAGVRRIFGRRGLGDDFCEDIVQEAMIRVQETIASFRGDSQLETWALAIATRVGFDELRHRRWKDGSLESLTSGADEMVPAAPASDPAPSEDRALLRAKVLAALRTVLLHGVTSRQREVLVAELEGMPQAEIAARLGSNRNAVYKLSHDARRRVRQQLEASGLTAGDVLWAFDRG